MSKDKCKKGKLTVPLLSVSISINISKVATMRSVLKKTVIHAASFYIAPFVVSGLKVQGDAATYIAAGFVLTLVSFIIKPLVVLLTLPFNILTLGFFSLFINALMLYIVTLFVPQITVSAFVLESITIVGIKTPEIAFNTFFAFVACAFVLSFVSGLLSYIMKD